MKRKKSKKKETNVKRKRETERKDRERKPGKKFQYQKKHVMDSEMENISPPPTPYHFYVIFARSEAS